MLRLVAWALAHTAHERETRATIMLIGKMPVLLYGQDAQATSQTVAISIPKSIFRTPLCYTAHRRRKSPQEVKP